MSAASFDTSVPVMPMAMPILAVFSAGASLMPSPVMATIWPLRCRALDDAQLVRRDRRAQTPAPARRWHRAPRRPCCAAPCRSRPRTRLEDVSSRAIAAAVAGWSPVIMTVRICAACATATAPFTSSRGGSIIPTRPSNTRSSSMSSGRSRGAMRWRRWIDTQGRRRHDARRQWRACGAPGRQGRRCAVPARRGAPP